MGTGWHLSLPRGGRWRAQGAGAAWFQSGKVNRLPTPPVAQAAGNVSHNRATARIPVQCAGTVEISVGETPPR